jgi:hypothetical protein
MNRIFIGTLLIFIALVTSARAEDIYIYKEKSGKIVITNRPIPEKYKEKAQKVDSFRYEAPSGKRRAEGVRSVQATKTYDPKSLEAEKERLEADITRLKAKESEDSNRAPYYRFFIKAYEESLQLLEKDPQSYFKKQQQMEREALKLLR